MNKEIKQRKNEQNEPPVKPGRKAAQVASTVLLIVCTLLCFVVVISSAVNQDASLFGFRLFYVVTGSMEPNYPVGSMLVVGECDSYAQGEVITFYSRAAGIEGYPNTHRIIEIVEVDGRRAYRTQGDANNIPDDEPVYPEDIIGKVYFCFDRGILHSLIDALKTPSGFFLIILVPILLIAVVCMRDFKKAMSEEIRRAAAASLEQENELAKKKECPEDETNATDTTDKTE